MKNLRLGVKLIGGFTLVAAIVLVVGIIGLVGSMQLQDEMNQIGRVRLPSIERLLKTSVAAEEMMSRQRILLNEKITMEERQDYLDEIIHYRGELVSSWEAFLELPATEEEVRLSNQFQTELDEWLLLNDQRRDDTEAFEELGILDPTQLIADLQLFRGDHYDVEVDVATLLLNDQSFAGGEDPTACNFGQWLPTFETDNPELTAILDEMREPHDHFHATVGDIKQAAGNGNRARAIALYQNEMLPASEDVFGHFDELIEYANEANSMRNRLISLVNDQVVPEANEALEILEEIIVINENIAEEAIQAGEAAAETVILTVIIGMIVGVILAMLFGIILTRGITGPVALGVAFAKDLADGKMNADLAIVQEDEIGQLAKAMQRMRDKLKEIIAEVQSATQNVSSGSEQLSSAAQQLSQGAAEQASSGEEVSSSMEEMSASIRQNSDNAMTTDQLAQKAAKNATSGGQAVSDTVDAMRDIAERITIIEEIARNTNLLALNAAIEAARAGEHGKGFAVVASEVRKLAERSQKAAVEISDVSKRSVSVAEDAGKTIGEVVEDIKKTAELVQEISASSNEQNSGAEQINTALVQLDQVTQQNAGSSEEIASTSEELSAQAEQLEQTMSFFVVDSSSYHRPALSGPSGGHGSGYGSGHGSTGGSGTQHSAGTSGASGTRKSAGGTSGGSNAGSRKASGTRSTGITLADDQARPQDRPKINLDEDEFEEF